MSVTPKAKVKNLYKLIAPMVLILASCNPGNSSIISMDSILKSPNQYHDSTVKTYGFFKSSPTPKLYKNLNGALYVNKHQSIGFQNLKEKHAQFFRQCSNKYLYITGTLSHDEHKGINFTNLTEVTTKHEIILNNTQPCHFIFEE